MYMSKLQTEKITRSAFLSVRATFVFANWPRQNSRRWPYTSLFYPQFPNHPQAKVSGSHAVDLRAGLGLAAFDLSGLRAVDVVGGDPVGIVSSGRGDSRAGSVLNNLALGRGLLLAGLATLALLGKVGRDPDIVEEVDDTDEAGQEEEVEEDATNMQSVPIDPKGMRRVEYTSGGRRCWSQAPPRSRCH